jgi:hypothetical protein
MHHLIEKMLFIVKNRFNPILFRIKYGKNIKKEKAKGKGMLDFID